MANNYLSVLYKLIIKVENENVGLKVGGHIYICVGMQYFYFLCKYHLFDTEYPINFCAGVSLNIHSFIAKTDKRSNDLNFI